MMLLLAHSLLLGLGARFAPTAVHRGAFPVHRSGGVCMGSDYVRGDDGGAPIDERLVDELIEARTSLRQARNFKAADSVRDDLQAMGVTLWDRDRVWMVGSEPPPPGGGRERGPPRGNQRGYDAPRGAGRGRDRGPRGGGGVRGKPDERGRIFV